MIKELKAPLSRLRDALQPLDVSDFIRPPADYIALYTPITLPPLEPRPDYGNLPKPHYSVTYGECKKLYETMDQMDEVLVSGKKTAAASEELEDLSFSLIEQLREIVNYADFITNHGKYSDDSDAYHLTTFINNFTNSTPRQKSAFPEFSGSTRHRMTVGNLREVLHAALDVEAVVNPRTSADRVVYLDQGSAAAHQLEPTVQ